MDKRSYCCAATTKMAVSRVRYPYPLSSLILPVSGGAQGGKKTRSQLGLRVISGLLVFFCVGLASLSAKDLSYKEYIVGPEDILDIQVWDNDDLSRTIEVSQQGDFTFPLIGRVHVGGLSVSEIETLMKKSLGDGYLVSPNVNVSVKEYKSQKVSILGEVKNPGSYALKRKTDILEVISQAGGFTDKAGQIITIVRPKSIQHRVNPASSGQDSKNEIIKLDLSDFRASSAYDNFPVMNGDSIYVNLAPRIFVTGEVKRAGEITWEEGLTVRQAISLAGGHTDKASPRRVIIIRMEAGKEKELKPRMDDLVVPGDIIKIPGRYF